jgi:hypothetical protein
MMDAAIARDAALGIVRTPSPPSCPFPDHVKPLCELNKKERAIIHALCTGRGRKASDDEIRDALDECFTVWDTMLTLAEDYYITGRFPMDKYFNAHIRVPEESVIKRSHGDPEQRDRWDAMVERREWIIASVPQ